MPSSRMTYTPKAFEFAATAAETLATPMMAHVPSVPTTAMTTAHGVSGTAPSCKPTVRTSSSPPLPYCSRVVFLFTDFHRLWFRFWRPCERNGDSERHVCGYDAHARIRGLILQALDARQRQRTNSSECNDSINIRLNFSLFYFVFRCSPYPGSLSRCTLLSKSHGPRPLPVPSPLVRLVSPLDLESRIGRCQRYVTYSQTDTLNAEVLDICVCVSISS